MTVAPPSVPLPESVPDQTVTGLFEKLPSTRKVPLLTAVVPECVLAPVSVHVPDPSLMSAVVPWNEAAFVASVFKPPTSHVTAFCVPRLEPPPAATPTLVVAENSPMGITEPAVAREYMNTFVPRDTRAAGKP